jgi:lysine biosynthesis protein LysW
MIKAINPVTEHEFDLPEGTEVNEMVTDPEDGSMFEVVSIEDGVASLEPVEVEEDWGE